MRRDPPGESIIKGLLRSFPDEHSLIDHLSKDRLDEALNLAEGRMKKKILATQEAIAAQARRLITCHEAYYNDRRAALMGKLARMVPELDRVFLCNSGTEAVEAALKFARLSTGRSGAVLIGPAVRNLAAGLHVSTFGGNPLGCAVALDVLESEDLPGQAAQKGTYLLDRLRELRSPLIREVRGLGLMAGVELKSRVAPYLAEMQERGVLAFAAGLTVIRLLPPLVITQADLDTVIEALRSAIAEPIPETAEP